MQGITSAMTVSYGVVLLPPEIEYANTGVLKKLLLFILVQVL